VTGSAATTTHLEPLREALLARARLQAEETLATADDVAAATLDEARADADELLAQARARGRQEADGVLAAQRAQAVRQARAVVLGARRAAFDDLREQARIAVRTLREDPGYPELLDALRERLHDELGPDAAIREHESGGLVGSNGGRTLSFAFDDLADRIVGRLDAEIEGLWSP